jgi:hypothetical protein
MALTFEPQASHKSSPRNRSKFHPLNHKDFTKQITNPKFFSDRPD